MLTGVGINAHRLENREHKGAPFLRNVRYAFHPTPLHLLLISSWNTNSWIGVGMALTLHSINTLITCLLQAKGVGV